MLVSRILLRMHREGKLGMVCRHSFVQMTPAGVICQNGCRLTSSQIGRPSLPAF